MINVLFAKYLRHALSRLRTEKWVRNPQKLFKRITIRVGDDAVHACYRESYAFQISESIGPKGDNLEINNLFMKPGRVEFQGQSCKLFGPYHCKVAKILCPQLFFLPSTFSQPGNDYLAKTWPYTFIWFSDIKLETHAFCITSQWTMSSGGWSQEKQSTRRSWECWSTSSENSSGFRSAAEYRKYCRWISCIVIVSMLC